MKKVMVWSVVFAGAVSACCVADEIDKLARALKDITRIEVKVNDKIKSSLTQQFTAGVSYTFPRAQGTDLVLYVKIGDMACQGAQAVVDAAGNPPFRGGGVSGFIHTEADKYQDAQALIPGSAFFKLSKMERESWKDDTKRRTGIPVGYGVGSAWLNSNEFMRIQCGNNVMQIIHASGPDCGAGQNINLLAPAYKNALLEAEKAGLKSIAFPLLSINIFSCPEVEATRTPIEVVINYLLDGHNSTINEVHVMAYGSQKYFDLLNKAVDSWIERYGRKI